MPFTFKSLSIPDIILIESKVFADLRGGFLETFKSSEFKKAGLPDNFPQDNLSWSKKDVLRGLQKRAAIRPIDPPVEDQHRRCGAACGEFEIEFVQRGDAGEIARETIGVDTVAACNGGQNRAAVLHRSARIDAPIDGE